MLILILLLTIGSVLAYLSRANLELVSLNLGPYVFADIPLFYVIIGSLVAGLVVAYLVNLIPAISNSLALRGKQKEIKETKSDVLELTKRIHQLELENEKLKHAQVVEPEDEYSL